VEDGGGVHFFSTSVDDGDENDWLTGSLPPSLSVSPCCRPAGLVGSHGPTSTVCAPWQARPHG
jgi:hypothetical protein